MKHLFRVLLVGLHVCLAAGAAANDTPSATAIEQFERHVRPVLVEQCSACHGAKKQEGGLRVDSREALLKGGDSGPAIVSEQPEASRLIVAIRRTGELKMPPESELTPRQIESLSEWIKVGAPWPKGSDQPVASMAETAKRHWAFQPIVDPKLPVIQNSRWPLRPLDHFVLSKLEANNLQASERADRRTLIRRATFDLLGLPPTPEEIAAFESDANPDAFKRLVDTLLESPHYGERWARYWLDVSRYADTKGYVFFEDKNFTWAHTYRDYVVRALNSDLPFDRFIIEQLAADQLDLGDDKRALTAMGFLTLGSRFMGNVHDRLDDQIDVVTRGFLGLTLACARCHDHKYDPLPQADYYALYGVFRSSAEPVVPPTFLPISDSEDARKFDVEMQARLAKLDEFINRKRLEIMKAARDRAADYLVAVHAKRNQPSTENFMLISETGGLNPAVIVRWEVALKEARGSNDSVWTIWQRLSDLSDDEFSAKAPAALQQMLAANDASTPIHPAVRATFQELVPTTMKDVAAQYGQLLSETQKRWQQLLDAAAKDNQQAPMRFQDEDQETLRQVLFGKNSPAVLPRSLGWGFLDLLPDRAAQGEYKKLLEAVEQWAKTGPGAPPRANVLHDSESLYEPVVFLRGNPNRRGKVVERRFLSVLNPSAQSFQNGSGRLELAKAIASPQNPLTARVIANRVWQQHFSEGLVRTPSDFGVRGELPTHPELLDHLATHFLRQGWSLKWLHREIMNSATYQQRATGGGERVDPDNKLLWKFPRRRLDYEALRDAALAVSGSLDRTVGGPPVDAVNGFNPRRTLYGFIERLDLPTVMRTFDFPDPAASSGQRSVTTVAPQALFFMNHSFVTEAARRTIQRPDLRGLTDRVERVRRLYAVVLGRWPTTDEEQVAEQFVAGRFEDSPTIDAWSYGYGRFDSTTKKTTDFVPLTHWTGSRWQVGPALPDPQKGWVFVDARGGHPAEHPDRAVIRRWTAPAAGQLQIVGKLKHGPQPGNGVRGRFVSSRNGQLGEWSVHHSEADFGALTTAVQTGDTLDLVVDFNGEITHDEHESPFEIHLKTDSETRVWNSEKDFRGDSKADRWQTLAHALLMANEFVFID